MERECIDDKIHMEYNQIIDKKHKTRGGDVNNKRNNQRNKADFRKLSFRRADFRRPEGRPPRVRSRAEACLQSGTVRSMEEQG